MFHHIWLIAYLTKARSPMDLRFTAKETAVVPADQQPAGLREYIANYQALCVSATLFVRRKRLTQPCSLGGRGEDPVAPLLVGYQGETFVLEHSANVRQSQEQVLIKSPGFGGRKEAPSASVPAVSETIVGQETLMKSMLCQARLFVSVHIAPYADFSPSDRMLRLVNRSRLDKVFEAVRSPQCGCIPANHGDVPSAGFRRQCGFIRGFGRLMGLMFAILALRALLYHLRYCIMRNLRLTVTVCKR